MQRKSAIGKLFPMYGGGRLARLQAQIFGGLSFDPFAMFLSGARPVEANVVKDYAVHAFDCKIAR